MKTSRSVTLILALVATMAGCGPSAHDRDRAALVTAYRQIKSWERQCTVTRGNRKQVNVPKMFKFFDTLDTRDCPKEFQLAWFDYLTCYKKHQHEMGAAVLEAGAALVTAGAAAPVLAREAVKTAVKSAQDNPGAAVRAVQRFWIEYGIGEKDLANGQAQTR